jgi:hypothetical protein
VSGGVGSGATAATVVVVIIMLVVVGMSKEWNLKEMGAGTYLVHC